MKHPLQHRLAKLRHRVRRLLTLYGASWVVATLLSAVVLVGAADWTSHRLRLGLFDDTGVRVIFAGAILALLGWTAWRFLWKPLSVRWGDLELSLRVERRFPELNDALASTMEFLRQSESDATAGSAALRRAVIEQSTQEVQKMDVDDVVQPDQARRAALTAAAICLATIGIVLLNPSAAARAVARLANPFADNPWPKQTHLSLVDYPRRVAVGDRFELSVGVEKGRLPAQGLVYYRLEGKRPFSEPLHRVGELLKAGRESVVGSFEFRVEAGDDQTDWLPVEAVPPPQLEHLQVRLEYPSYTRKEPEELPEGVGQVRALRGTTVDVRARANKSLSSAALRFADEEETPAELAASGRDLTAKFTVQKNGSYWVHLVDREPEAFTNQRQASRFEVRSLDDLAPDVHFEHPSSHLQVTADARLPLRVLAKDDWGVADIQLHYARSDRSEQPPTVLALYDGEERPLRHSVDYAWDLAPLGLTYGTVVTIQAVATDYDDLDGPNVGKSPEIRLEIVTEDDVLARMDELQGVLYDELNRILQTQKLSLSQVTDLQVQLEHVGRLNKPDLDNLQGAEMAQRHVSQGLTSATDGVRGMVRRMLEDLRNNRIDDLETTERLQAIEAAIGQLESEPLPAIEQQLTRARKAALNDLSEAGQPRSPQRSARGAEQAEGDAPSEGPGSEEPGRPDDENASPKGDEAPRPEPEEGTPRPAESPPRQGAPHSVPQEALAEAGENQQQVVAALEGMLNRLAKWEHYRDVVREVNDLIQGEQQVAAESSDVGKRTLAKKLDELSAQDRSDLERAAGKQRELADRTDRLMRRLEEIEKKLQTSDPMVAESFGDAARQARDAGISSTMRQAGKNLQGNRVGEASQNQQRSLQALKDVLDTLENRRENELAKLVQKLKEAEEELRNLRNEQAAHLKKTNDAGAQGDEQQRRDQLQRLAARQEELQRQAEQFARKLQRLQAQQAGQSTQQAAGNMGQAQQAMQQSQGGQAQQQQEQALDQLERAQSQLAQTRRRAEEQLAMEQLARIGDQLAQMLERQNGLIEQTRRVDQERLERATLSRGARRTVQNTSQTQSQLKDETDELVERLTAAPVFSLALRGAARNMDRAARLLDQFQTDATTQQAQQNAAHRFEQLLDALKPESGEGEQQQGGGGGGGGGGNRRDGIPPMAQIKMLKSLQLEINERTKELDELSAGSEGLSPEQEIEFQALSEEQGRLAEIVVDLIRPADEEIEP